MDNESVGRRLKLVGMAMGFTSTRAFAEFLEIEENQLGKYLRGSRGLTLQPVVDISNRTAYTIEFLYKGDRRGLTSEQLRALAGIEKDFAARDAAWAQRGRSEQTDSTR